jgi:hypothetical protein
VIFKKIAEPSYAASRTTAVGIQDLVRYIRGHEIKDENTKVLYSNALGFIATNPTAQEKEMIALAAETVHSKRPVIHYMMSWQTGEQPTPAQVDQAVKIFMKEAGLDSPEHQVIYALHADTDNFHLHMAVNRVNPETLRVSRVNDGFDKIVGHRAIAKIEGIQGWQRQKKALFTYHTESDDGTQGAGCIITKPPDAEEKTISGKAADMEASTGVDSMIRIGRERGQRILESARSWEELHRELAAVGMRYDLKGSGAIIYVGETVVKASAIGRQFALAKMTEKLGRYTPKPEETEVIYEQPRPKRNRRSRDRNAKQNAALPWKRAGHRLRGLSECRLAPLGRPEQAGKETEESEGLLQSNARSGGREFRRVRRARGGVKRSPGTPIRPLRRLPPAARREAEQYAEYRKERKKLRKIYKEKIERIKTLQKEEYQSMVARQSEERRQKTSGNWQGRGKALNAIRSVVAFEQAAERQRMKARHSFALKQAYAEAKKAVGPYIPTLEAWLRRKDDKQAEEIRFATAEECSISAEDENAEAPFILAGIAIFHYYNVDSNGWVYYSLAYGQMPQFVDTGKEVIIYNENDYNTVLAAMQLSVKKWGKIRVNGSDEYKKFCIKVARENGITIVNPELQEMITKDKLLNSKVIDMKRELEDFNAYHNAVNADAYRVTCIRMHEDGSKKTFILDKRDNESKGFTPEQMPQQIQTMLNLQKRGENIYFTPLSQDKHHILVDDMDAANLEKFILDGFKPAVLIESSPGSYQAVITIPKLNTEHDRHVGNRITEKLNKLYGDKNLSGCIHPHRAPGFQNRKPKHKAADGSYPFVKLVKSEQRICEKTLQMTEEINSEYERLQEERKKAPKKERISAHAGSPTNAYYRHLDNITSHLAITDNSRVDAMIALRMRGTGHSREAVVEAVLACAKQWRGEEEDRNWRQYAERTADYAFGVAGDRELQRWQAYIEFWTQIERGEEKAPTSRKGMWKKRI